MAADFLHDFLRDVRYCVRALRRAPAFTLLSVATLALGIGAATAVFSVVNGVLIRPLPYPAPETLVSVWNTSGDAENPGLTPLSATQFFTYRDENRTLTAFGLWSMRTATATVAEHAEEVRSLQVTDGTLQAIGVRPAIGRWFTSDDSPGSAASVILLDRYWKQRYGGEASVIGRTMVVDARPTTIIGVMPAGFRFLNEEPDVIVPFTFDRSRLVLGAFNYFGIARLKQGVGVDHAGADLARLNTIWLEAWPSPPGFDRRRFEKAPVLRPLKREVVGEIGSVLWMLMAMAGLVLLVASANVANLLLARAQRRRQEIAVRAALGAPAHRIVRERLIESVLLGLLGGAFGLALAFAGLRALLASVIHVRLPRIHEIGVDPVVVGFALLVSLVSGVAFGLFPVLRIKGLFPVASLRSNDRHSSESREQRWTSNVLVITQVGVAAVLLVGSGLMIRTVLALRNVDPGFADPDRIQLARLTIPETLVSDPERVFRMQRDIRERVARIPGVSSASLASAGPMERFLSANAIFVEDRHITDGKLRRFKFVFPDYFRVTGAALLAGRDFEPGDLEYRRAVAVISESLASEVWQGPAAAVGRRIRESPEGPWREIVGVVRDVADDGLHVPAPPTVYWPALQENFEGAQIRIKRSMTLVIRSARAGTDGLLKDVQHAVAEVNGGLPLARVQTLGALYEGSLATTSFTLVMLLIAGSTALLLGLVAVHGVIAYAVAQRTHEIGIRVALGAPPTQVRRLFIRQGVLLAGVGTISGLLAAIGLTRFLSALVFGISTFDPLTYVGAGVALMAMAACASYIPARRATAVDPVTALQSHG